MSVKVILCVFGIFFVQPILGKKNCPKSDAIGQTGHVRMAERQSATHVGAERLDAVGGKLPDVMSDKRKKAAPLRSYQAVATLELRCSLSFSGPGGRSDPYSLVSNETVNGARLRLFLSARLRILHE